MRGESRRGFLILSNCLFCSYLSLINNLTCYLSSRHYRVMLQPLMSGPLSLDTSRGYQRRAALRRFDSIVTAHYHQQQQHQHSNTSDTKSSSSPEWNDHQWRQCYQLISNMIAPVLVVAPIEDETHFSAAQLKAARPTEFYLDGSIRRTWPIVY